MRLGQQLIGSLIVCYCAHIVVVPIENYFAQGDADGNQVDQRPEQSHRAISVNNYLRRFVKSSSQRMSKGSESMGEYGET